MFWIAIALGKKYHIIFLWKAKIVAFFSVPRAVRYSPRASGLPLPSRLSTRVPAKNSENHADTPDPCPQLPESFIP